MKLVYCTECHDLFNLTGREKVCSCGKTGGKYLNNIDAEYWGPSYPLGFANASFVAAMRTQPEDGMGQVFKAFVIPKECVTMIKTDKEKEINTDPEGSVNQEEFICLELTKSSSLEDWDKILKSKR